MLSNAYQNKNAFNSRSPIKLTYNFALVVTNLGVTRHEVTDDGEMLDGIWLDDDSLQDVMLNMNNSISTSRNVDLTIQPDNILINNDEILAWFTPQNFICDQWYSSYSNGNNIIQIKNVPHPQLIFIVKKRDGQQKLNIVATKSSDRPHLDTPIFHAPFSNMYNTMHLCIGSAQFPSKEDIGINTINVMQNALFSSRYSGTKFKNIKPILNCSTELTLATIEYYKRLENKTSFPTEDLIPNPKYPTLKSFLQKLIN